MAYENRMTMQTGQPDPTVYTQNTASGRTGQFSLWNWLTGKGNETAQSYQTNERLAAEQFNSAEAAKAREFEHNENALARDWQERMSNTAIQRQMADASAAGVNPFYLFSGAGSNAGAGVPMASGSTSAQNASSSPSTFSDNSAAAVTSAISGIAKIVALLAK